LSEAVGVEVWIKRDDLTGLLLGGNKARKLEFLCGDALASGADTLVTGGGPGSNHVQLTAAAAARLALGCVVVCYGQAPAAEPLGLRLTRQLGADVVFTGSPDRTSVDTRLEEVAAKLTAAGQHPYVIPRGGASPVGAVGYAAAAAELAAQLTGAVGYAAAAAEIAGQLAGAGTPASATATVLLATGSCGTQAGLIAGAALPSDVSTRLEIVGVPVSRPPEECTERIVRLATGCAKRLGSDRIFTAGDVRLLGGYLGPGYGKASPEGIEAALLAARTEGLVLDPVFTAKAMAALVVECRRGALPGPVVFLHTGGTPSALAALP
jgi:D-cysteine desulfhydrase